MTTAAPHSPAVRLLGYELRDVLRSRWAAAYALFFLAVTDAFFRFSGGGEQVVLSLVNVVLILIPLVNLVFGVGYLYNAREFTELMLAQPVRRRDLFLALYGGLAVPLALGFVLGVTLPFAWHDAAVPHAAPLVRLLLAGVLLTATFLALALLLAVRFDDRVKGLGAALLLWLGLAVLYDGLVLLVAYTFSDWPLETPMLVLTTLNPISLARVLLLLSLDVAALLGYTGAAFERFFGDGLGTATAFGALALWAVVPLGLAYRRFVRKDF
ncbi:MAG: ABC transporter permease subunit [Rubricoccaceae bacterium]|nr:ABC transporter permease subunit [Rubricoccaceae bacterium]